LWQVRPLGRRHAAEPVNAMHTTLLLSASNMSTMALYVVVLPVPAGPSMRKAEDLVGTMKSPPVFFSRSHHSFAAAITASAAVR
jgi:hypothetical protein